MFENNPVTKLLKIKYPIIQGGMAWVADADLAAAVSNGGGLGIIAAANMPPELLERQIIKIRTLTDKPFGVNPMLTTRLNLPPGITFPSSLRGRGCRAKCWKSSNRSARRSFRS